jgi:hypothetical protein
LWSKAGAIILAGAVGFGLEAQAQTLPVTQITVTVDQPALPHVEPVVAVHPSQPGVVAVATMEVQAPMDERFYDSWRVVVFVSMDGGVTWLRRPLPPTPSGRAMGDVNLAWAADGSLYLSALVRHPDRSLHAWLFQSFDHGRSWTVGPVASAGTGSQDHPVLDVRATGHQPTIAVFSTIALDGISGALRRPGEKEFHPTTLYSPNRENNNLGWGLDLGGNGILLTYYSMDQRMPTPLWAVRSADGGQTWSRSKITDHHVPVGFPMLAEDRSHGVHVGRVYSVWVSDEETGNIMLNHSDDGGASWSKPVIVQRDRSAVLRARPAVHVNGEGVVMVSWTDGRRDTGGRGAWCWDVFASVSLDGGQTFNTEVQLTDSLTCSQTPANGQAGQRWRWGGDYSGIASDAAGQFYISWSDTRSGVFQPRLARLSVPARYVSAPGRE